MLEHIAACTYSPSTDTNVAISKLLPVVHIRVRAREILEDILCSSDTDTANSIRQLAAEIWTQSTAVEQLNSAQELLPAGGVQNPTGMDVLQLSNYLRDLGSATDAVRRPSWSGIRHVCLSVGAGWIDRQYMRTWRTFVWCYLLLLIGSVTYLTGCSRTIQHVSQGCEMCFLEYSMLVQCVHEDTCNNLGCDPCWWDMPSD